MQSIMSRRWSCNIQTKVVKKRHREVNELFTEQSKKMSFMLRLERYGERRQHECWGTYINLISFTNMVEIVIIFVKVLVDIKCA